MMTIQWPWQRIARDRRPYIWLALFLISMSGLISGVLLRPLTTQWRQPTGSTSPGVVAQASPTATAPIVAVSVTPQKFVAKLAPIVMGQPGGSFAITALTTLAKTGKPAPGVICHLTFAANAHIPAPPPQTTDATGTTTWTISIPATTPRGSYQVLLNATWQDGFKASWQSTATVG